MGSKATQSTELRGGLCLHFLIWEWGLALERSDHLYLYDGAWVMKVSPGLSVFLAGPEALADLSGLFALS